MCFLSLRTRRLVIYIINPITLYYWSLYIICHCHNHDFNILVVSIHYYHGLKRYGNTWFWTCSVYINDKPNILTMFYCTNISSHPNHASLSNFPAAYLYFCVKAVYSSLGLILLAALWISLWHLLCDSLDKSVSWEYSNNSSWLGNKPCVLGTYTRHVHIVTYNDTYVSLKTNPQITWQSVAVPHEEASHCWASQHTQEATTLEYFYDIKTTAMKDHLFERPDIPRRRSLLYPLGVTKDHMFWREHISVVLRDMFLCTTNS